MKIITEEQVAALGITPAQCVDWVVQSFRSKPRADMPAKISVHPFLDSFYTAMPCYHPDTGRVGVKVVSRVPNSNPPLKSKMMLFEASSGDLLALIDTNWITAMRTGAVAALAAKTFAADFAKASFGFVGLGNIGDEYVKLENYSKAIEYYEFAMKDKTLRDAAYYKIGQCYAKNKQYDKAIEVLTEALKVIHYTDGSRWYYFYFRRKRCNSSCNGTNRPCPF